MPAIKGADKLRVHLPDFPRMLKYYVGLTIISAICGFSIMGFIENLPWLFPGITFLQVIAPLLPIIGLGIVEFIEFSTVHRMWTKKDLLLSTMKERAYQHALLYVCFGINLEYIVITRIFLPISSASDIGQLLATPLLSLVPVWIPFTPVIRIVAGLTFFGIGFTLMFRSTLAFGVDYLLYMYLYFPGESKIQQNAIYSIVRHPTYLAFILMCFGGALWWFSTYSFIFFLLVVTRWQYHVHFVEEKELIERFGESYRKYRQSVHAFVVLPKHLRQFFQFLLGRA